MKAVFAYITCPSPAAAERIGRVLVAERLAACVNLLPGMRSLYRWQGAIETAEETVLIAKTLRLRAAALTRRVLALHPYSCPCVAILPVTGGSAAYLAWLAEGSSPERQRPAPGKRKPGKRQGR
jgi:periplasmic divalent cation tolerance protein